MSRIQCTPMVVVLLAACIVSPGWANDASQALNQQAIEKLKSGDYVGTLGDADAAVAADPSDGQSHFLRGMALNRLGDFPEAVRALNRSVARGYTHEHGLFEVGWAALGAGRSRDAIAALGAYEQVHPGRAQTSEFMGRAYMQLGQYDRAEALLQEAVERDPQLTPTANIYLSLIEKLRGRNAESMAYIRSSIDRYPQSPVSQTMQEHLREMAVANAPRERRWRLTISSGVGYNDNVAVIDDGIPLPPGLRDRGGVFFRNTLHGAYDVLRDAEQVATAGYAFQADTYGDGQFDAYDYTNNYWYGEYFRRLSDRVVAGIRISDDWARIGGRNFRNRLGVRPSIGYRFNDVLSGELAYTFRWDDYFYPTTSFLDRDALGNWIEGTFYLDPPKLPLRLEFGAKYLINSADGTDFDYQATTLFITGEAPLPLDITGEVTYAYTYSDYDNPNSLTAFTLARTDNTHLVRAQLTKPIPIHKNVRARVYIRYEYVNNDSNVNAYDHGQNVISGGVVIDF